MRLKNSHTRTRAVVHAILIATLAVGLTAGSVFAAKPTAGGGGGKPGGGGTTGGGTLALVTVTDGGDGVLNWSDVVTFAVTSSAAAPMVNLTCYQGGDWVTNQSVGFYAGWPWSRNFNLSSWKWTGGAADCTAKLYYSNSKGGQVTQATLSFYAAP